MSVLYFRSKETSGTLKKDSKATESGVAAVLSSSSSKGVSAPTGHTPTSSTPTGKGSRGSKSKGSKGSKGSRGSKGSKSSNGSRRHRRKKREQMPEGFEQWTETDQNYYKMRWKNHPMYAAELHSYKQALREVKPVDKSDTLDLEF
uniref:Chromo domain-containing protein n=1 Tax=Ascaris lumbricoides TaxID=6252 RepID=A0A0M3HRK3_ASCLU